MWRQREREVSSIVTNRDLRRTWKTLAGKAGLSKGNPRPYPKPRAEDVSCCKSYDRWTYMPEKRAGMEKWNEFVTVLLAPKLLTIAA
jgi:hypothetical protein